MKKIIQILAIASMMLAWGNQSLAIMAATHASRKEAEARQAIGAGNFNRAQQIIDELNRGKWPQKAQQLSKELQQAQAAARGAPLPPAGTPIPAPITPAPQGLQLLFDLIASGITSPQAAMVKIAQFIQKLDSTAVPLTGRTVTYSLDDAMDKLVELGNFLGGQPAGITSVDKAIEKLNQWAGNPMAGGYNPATAPYDLKSIIVPGWTQIQPLLLATGQTGAATAITNLGSLLARILPPPATGTRTFNEFNGTLNRVLTSCGTLGTPGTQAANLGVAQRSIDVLLNLGGKIVGRAAGAAVDLNEVAENLLTLVNNLEGDLGTGGQGNYTLANVPAVDIAQLSNMAIAQTGANLDPALAAFLTDAAGAPADQAAAAAKVQAFQTAANKILPNVADDLNGLQSAIAEIIGEVKVIQGGIRASGYTAAGGGAAFIAANPNAAANVIDDIMAIP